MRRVEITGKQAVAEAVEAAGGPGRPVEGPAARRAIGVVGTKGGVEEREPRHPLGRAPQDLLRDLAAEGEAGQGEARGRLGQDLLGDRADIVAAGDVADLGLCAISPSAAIRSRQ